MTTEELKTFVILAKVKNFTLAAEYLHGGRKNMDGLKGDANRVSIMMQYNF